VAKGITYAECKALDPCSNDFKRVAKLLGGKKGWNGNLIDAASARAAGCTINDILWVASALSRKDADIERRLRLFAADCAAHVLHIYERSESSPAPRNSIIASRQYARGEIDDAAWDAARAAARDAAWDAAQAAARDAAGAAAGAAEEAWQFARLVERLSENEPEDWPLPAKSEAVAA